MKRSKRSVLTMLAVFAVVVLGAGMRPVLAETTWYVDDNAPADFVTIQAAIDAASGGDTIVVRDGYYTGDGNRDIDFGGKAVHLMSENGPENCIIDAEGSETEPHRGFVFHSGEDGNSIVAGFTITGGYAEGATWEQKSGGAISCTILSCPTITNNMITGNAATDGGAIYCKESSPTITHNIIMGNTAVSGGGGLYCRQNASPVIANNTIVQNTSDYVGGGICCYQFFSSIQGNTISGNSADVYGGGILLDDSSTTIINSIVWNNAAQHGHEIALRMWGEPSVVTVAFSDVAGGDQDVYVAEDCLLNWGPGNIDADPLFADPDIGDYHLKSRGGRWDPAANGGTGGWVTDSAHSPCIDAGDPASDYAQETEPNGGCINAGAYGNTLEASKSEWILGDVTGDCVVNVLDAINVRNHLYEPVGSGDNWRYDLNGDGMINVLDMLVVRNNARNRCE